MNAPISSTADYGRPADLRYETLERLPVLPPVDRLAYIAEVCRGKSVLDVGCLDETALAKRDTEFWLHGRIGQVARRVVGVDTSTLIPPEGIITGTNAVIHKGDGVELDAAFLQGIDIDLVVAGEFIEHLDNPMRFLRNVKQRFPGRELILSTPNGVSFANTLMGSLRREIQHQDHVANFSYKILSTLCRRAEFTAWQIQPYRFYATEMILSSSGPKKAAAISAERGIRIVERLFPLLCFGYIVRARL